MVIPGVQGRWEWMLPALRALAKRCRTISYSLPPVVDFEQFVAQMDATLDERGIEKAAICGVSFGGLIALKYAAARPERTKRLILVSTPSPSWTPSPLQARYLARPWLALDHASRLAARVWPEIAARSTGGRRASVLREHGTGRRRAGEPAQMATRVRLRPGPDLCADCRRSAPTLVITGEATLDTVVPVSSTL